MRALGWAGRIAGALCVAILVVGLPVLVLQAPIVTRTLVGHFYDADETGLSRTQALTAAEQVRAYTTDPSAPALPARVGDRAGFDESAASHLRDVRGVLLAARTLTLLVALAGAGLCAVALSRGRRAAVAWSLTAGAVGVLVAAAVCAVLGAQDFDRFFAAFHGLFFAAGTWTFELGTLLIQLFPEPLWATLGGLWATGAALLALSCLTAAWAVRDPRRFPSTE
jgi:hypothetical protein